VYAAYHWHFVWCSNLLVFPIVDQRRRMNEEDKKARKALEEILAGSQCTHKERLFFLLGYERGMLEHRQSLGGGSNPVVQTDSSTIDLFGQTKMV
jgi:hypothetical protein